MYSLNATITTPTRLSILAVVIVRVRVTIGFLCGIMPCLFFDSHINSNTYVFANAMMVGIHGQTFVATDVERSDCVHVLLGAWQR